MLFPNVGEKNALALLFQANTFVLHLFKSNTTPVAATVIGDFTEADFAGYAAATLDLSATITTNGGGAAQLVAAAATFTRSSTGTSQNVYGWYITQAGNLICAHRFSDAPVVLTNSGDALTVTPTLTDQDVSEI